MKQRSLTRFADIEDDVEKLRNNFVLLDSNFGRR